MMDIIAFSLGCAWTFTGLVTIGLAIPLVGKRIGPNPFYGVRFAQSFRSTDAWYAINCFGGKRLIVWALPIVLLGMGCFFLKLQEHPALTIVLGLAPLICLIAPILQCRRFAQRYG